MRALSIALALAVIATAASAQDNGAPNGSIRVDVPPPRAPAGVRKQAEDAVRAGLARPASAVFRNEGVSEAESVKQGAFGQRIAGPVSVVCGQYATADGTDYAWFFAAIKAGQLLWTSVDAPADDPGAAYASCKNAHLAR